MRVKAQLVFPGMCEKDSDLKEVGTAFIPAGQADTKA